MPRKRSGIELVVEFFTSADLPTATLAIQTVQAIMRARNDAGTVATPKKPRRAYTKRTPKDITKTDA